jgi:hypothetical protein
LFVGFELPVQAADVAEMGLRHRPALLADDIEVPHPLKHPRRLVS